MERTAMASPATTTGRLTTASVVRIAACGWLMMGTEATEPSAPVLFSVNVPPCTSLDAQCPPARGVGEAAQHRSKVCDAQRVGVPHHRNHEPGFRGNGDGDVDAVVERNAPVVPSRVEARVFAQRGSRRARGERQEGERNAMLLPERGAEPLTRPARVR